MPYQLYFCWSGYPESNWDYPSSISLWDNYGAGMHPFMQIYLVGVSGIEPELHAPHARGLPLPHTPLQINLHKHLSVFTP